MIKRTRKERVYTLGCNLGIAVVGRRVDLAGAGSLASRYRSPVEWILQRLWLVPGDVGI